tara:strand:- start:238 stop:408 length:171 start_codon:yes stop_codon:yes gene_type:complete
MPKSSYKSMGACMADYKNMKDAASICKGKVKPVKKGGGNSITPQPDMKMKKGGSSY